jgi:hypothetical protein
VYKDFVAVLSNRQRRVRFAMIVIFWQLARREPFVFLDLLPILENLFKLGNRHCAPPLSVESSASTTTLRATFFPLRVPSSLT